MINKTKNWIEERLGIEAFMTSKLREHKLPRETGYMNTLGTVALVAFLVQAVTGILLLVYYVPHPEQAFASVQTIMNDVAFGWLFRQMHLVGSNIMVAVLIVHLMQVFFRGIYKKPRELTWLSGGLMLLLVAFAGVTGYLLPWSQLGYWSTTVFTTFPTVVPGVGDALAVFFRGGDAVSAATLSRFFAFHVAIFPFLLTLLVLLHVILVRRTGMAPHSAGDMGTPRQVGGGYVKQSYPQGMPFYPDFIIKAAAMVLIYMAVMFFFIAFLPKYFMPAAANIIADPLHTPDAIIPPWYFLASYQFIKLIPSNFVGVVLQAIMVLLLFTWPFFDSTEETNIMKRPFILVVFLSALTLWLFLTAWGGM